MMEMKLGSATYQSMAMLRMSVSRSNSLVCSSSVRMNSILGPHPSLRPLPMMLARLFTGNVSSLPVHMFNSTIFALHKLSAAPELNQFYLYLPSRLFTLPLPRPNVSGLPCCTDCDHARSELVNNPEISHTVREPP